MLSRKNLISIGYLISLTNMKSPPQLPSPRPLRGEGELECSICLNLLTENPEEEEPVAGPSRLAKRARVLPELHCGKCGHVFHKFCITPWLKQKACPLCREKMSKGGMRKVILPLSEDGQCRKCKERVIEVDGMKFQMGEEKKRMEEMEGKLEEKGKQVEELEEKVEEIQMAMDTDLVKYKREVGNMALDFEEAKIKMREDFGREMEEIQESGEREMKMGEEKLRKVMKLKGEAEEKLKVAEKEFFGRLEKVKEENKKLKRDKEGSMEEGGRIMEGDWEEMYKLCKMERDKERGKAAYYEKWCKRLSGIEESSPCDIRDLTEVMQGKLNEKRVRSKEISLPVPSYNYLITSKSTCGIETVDLHKDLDLSESDDDQEGNLESAFTSGFEDDLVLSSEEDRDNGTSPGSSDYDSAD